MSYNLGKEADRKKGLEVVVDHAKLLITLATGSVALSATFLAEFYEGESLPLLVASWIVLGVSAFLGIVVVGEVISQFAESRIRPRHGSLEVFALLQFLAVLLGIVLFAIFVIKNVTAEEAASARRGTAVAIPISSVELPVRLTIDTPVRFEPSMITRLGQLVRATVTVRDTRGFLVHEALVSIRTVPRLYFRVEPREQKTSVAGTAVFRLAPNPQLTPSPDGGIAILVRARKGGEDPLAGVSNRRLFKLPVALSAKRP